jgi:hypothetical protein
VTYFLATPTNNSPGLDLFRSVTRNLLPVAQEVAEDQYLMGGVDAITYQYYDGNSWKDTWDSTTEDTTTGLTNNLPRAIKVALALRLDGQGRGTPAPVELIVPIPVLQRTNLITSVGGEE